MKLIAYSIRVILAVTSISGCVGTEQPRPSCGEPVRRAYLGAQIKAPDSVDYAENIAMLRTELAKCELGDGVFLSKGGSFVSALEVYLLARLDSQFQLGAEAKSEISNDELAQLLGVSLVHRDLRSLKMVMEIFDVSTFSEKRGASLFEHLVGSPVEQREKACYLVERGFSPYSEIDPYYSALTKSIIAGDEVSLGLFMSMLNTTDPRYGEHIAAALDIAARTNSKFVAFIEQQALSISSNACETRKESSEN